LSGKKFSTKQSKILQVSGISLINSAVMFLLPVMGWVCHDDNFETATGAEQQFFCEDGQTNQMARIFFGSRGKAIVRILSNPDQFYASTLAIVGMVFFVLMLYTNTTSIPSGLFTPIVVSGASLGGAYGLFLKEHVNENIDPSAFALLGVGAIMAGIQRSTVSTCVILLEGTGQTRILLPSMAVVVIANYVAHLIYEDGIYEVLIKLKGYPYLDHAKDDCYDVLTVRDVMSTPPQTVREKEKAQRLVDLLRETHHNGFPVVDEDGRFKGLVRRKQMVALIECGVFEEEGHLGDSQTNKLFESLGTSSYRNKSGKNDQGLMHYAFHIKDNRYDYVVENVGEDEEMAPSVSKQETPEKKQKGRGVNWAIVRSAVKMDMAMKQNKRRLGGDITMPAVNVATIDSSNFFREDTSDAGIDGGGDYIDSDTEESDEDAEDESKISSDTKRDDFVTNSIHEVPKGFARVGRDLTNNVVKITWLNKNCKDCLVDLEAVMNLGTYSVPEHFPLSKAYNLFTLLGLRWIVVVGGVDGGTVVGVLTRESFSESYLREKTGMDPRAFQ